MTALDTRVFFEHAMFLGEQRPGFGASLEKHPINGCPCHRNNLIK